MQKTAKIAKIAQLIIKSKSNHSDQTPGYSTHPHHHQHSDIGKYDRVSNQYVSMSPHCSLDCYYQQLLII